MIARSLRQQRVSLTTVVCYSMARLKNDGRGRLGGRSKGTPNKATSTLREWIVEVLDDNRDQMLSDLKQLQPIERLRVLERLMQYVVAKPTTVAEQPPQYDFGELMFGFDDVEFKE